MKKISKIILISVFIFVAICQLNTNVYSYTLQEVKRIIDLKTVEEDGEPEDYDVLIEGKDLIDNEEVPCIQTSIETVLYGKDGLLDIDFLNVNSENDDEDWVFLSGLVRNLLHIFLYIVAAALLTLLIYIAVLLVSSGINNKKRGLPFKNIFNRNDKNPKRQLEEKKFIEQWISAVLMLAFIIVIINLIISFSKLITEIVTKNEIEQDSIVVYVKDSKLVNEATWYTDAGFSAGPISSNLYWPVDKGSISSHFGHRNAPLPGASTNHKGIDIACPSGTEVHATQNGTVIQAGEAGTAGIWVVIDHGNGLVTKYMHNKKVLVRVGDVVSKGKAIAISGNTGNSTGPHLHFQIEQNGTAIDPETFQYDNAPAGIGGSETIDPSGSNSSQSTTISYYFKTNLEGLLMFQTQYDWEYHAVRNFVNLLSASFLVIFKCSLYGLFIIRTGALAVLIAIVPIVIIIDAFMKISGSKGILKRWFILFLYLIFQKPVIAVLYYVLAKSNVYLISESSYYMLFVIAIIIILFVFSIKWLFKKIKKG